jgi:hypothetical protein
MLDKGEQEFHDMNIVFCVLAKEMPIVYVPQLFVATAWEAAQIAAQQLMGRIQRPKRS